MSEAWNDIRELIVGEEFNLGPYFGHQVRHQPRHLLFTLSRYKFAKRMLPALRQVSVLELGCNEGVGSIMLTEGGNTVLGVDADAQAIAYAQANVARPGLNFQCANFIGDKFGAFDAVVSLDVIEHIDTSLEDAYMATVVDNLAPNGMAVIGTPNDTASQYASKASQIGHINMYTAERLVALMDKYFHNVFIFGLNDEVVHTGFYAMCHYLMVVGCNAKNPKA